MLDTGYLYSKNNDRIFINTCLGCNGACSYCYLPRLGYNNKSNDLLVREASQIIKDIEESGINIDEKTLITLGCFSECWDEKNRPQTIELIRYFLQKGNQIQLSTKKQVTVEDVEGFQDLIKYMGQLVIFVSSASISQWEQIERNTDSPTKRFETFKVSKKLNIPTVLYMKLILQGITIQDIKLYQEVVKRYGIKDVVVGSIFKEKESEETVHFSNKNKLFYNPVSDELEIKRRLMGMCNVYSRSSEVMSKYREKYLEEER